MAPQLPQDKAPNPNLAFEARQCPIPTSPSSVTSLRGPASACVAAPALEFGIMFSVPSPLPQCLSLARSLLSHRDRHSLLTALPVASLAPSSPFSLWQPE